jgi:hypothetical protein
MALDCTICNAPKAKSCASCHSAAYCSPECQQTDWPLHKTVCKALKSVPPRPDASHKLAILFPVDSKVPELIWVFCEPRKDDEEEGGYPYEYPHIREHLGDDKAFPEHKPVTRNVYRGFNLDHTIDITCRDAFLIDGSKINQCIVETTRGAVSHSWSGPIVVMRQPSLAYDPRFYSDITLADLRTAIDYFIAYGNESVVDSTFARSSRPKVDGVKINCFGDQDVFGAEKYTAVAVPKDHQVFFSPRQPHILKLLEVPILVRKYPPDRLWKNDRHRNRYPYDNQAATFLHLDANPKSESWGWAPREWQNDVGSVIVVRADRKPISPKQVEALCYYCQFKLQPLFEDSMGAGYVQRTREEVMGYMTKQKFAEFFAWYKEDMMPQDPTWALEKSPYEI